MNTYRACLKCVAPKRHPGCHETCPEYKKDKERHQSLKDRNRSLDIKDDVLKGYYFKRHKS